MAGGGSNVLPNRARKIREPARKGRESFITAKKPYSEGKESWFISAKSPGVKRTGGRSLEPKGASNLRARGKPGNPQQAGGGKIPALIKKSLNSEK